MRAIRAILALQLLIGSSHTLTAQRPSVLLFEADLRGARAFAVQTAASRGWRIRAVSAATAVFEQLLTGEAAEDGVMVAERILRVFANFAEESAGVRVYLRAEEVDWPGTDDEQATDVTGRYAANLGRALSSLGARWDASRQGSPARQPERPSPEAALFPAPQGPNAPIGTWSYAAERYALSRGCELTDQPTLLEASGADWEVHRVPCREGSSVLTRCRFGDCTSVP